MSHFAKDAETEGGGGDPAEGHVQPGETFSACAQELSPAKAP